MYLELWCDLADLKTLWPTGSLSRMQRFLHLCRVLETLLHSLQCNVTWMRAGGYLSNVGQRRLHCIHGAGDRRAGKLQGHKLLKAER